jgi:hypothetical protein
VTETESAKQKNKNTNLKTKRKAMGDLNGPQTNRTRAATHTHCAEHFWLEKADKPIRSAGGSSIN